MEPKIEFFVLGPLLVRKRDRVVPVPRGKERVVLATLLLNAGRVVSIDELAESAWGAEPPRSACVTLQNYVKRLRQSLGADGRTRIHTEPPGYRLAVDVDEFDVLVFEALVRGVRAAARDCWWRAVAEQARAALSLWRGQALVDIRSDTLVMREVPRLAEMRMETTEMRIEADLRLGGHRAVVPELERLIGAHPLREHLYTLLMLALSGCGRRADALAVYRRARRTLLTELGTEPGAELRDTHLRILNTGGAELPSPLLRSSVLPR